MYYCNNCGGEFHSPKVLREMHGLNTPPYERLLVCPICKSDSFYEINTTHCRACGAKLSHEGSEYCSYVCKAKGEKLWQKQKLNIKLINEHPLFKKIRELERFNRENSMCLSYGQYVAFTKMRDKKKK